MGTAADDLRDREEDAETDRWLHDNMRCDGNCPYCQIDKEEDEHFQMYGDKMVITQDD
jgi:hypothetical protein